MQGGFQRLVKLGSSHRFVKEAVTGVFGFAQALSGGIAREYESRDFALIPVLNALDRMLTCHPVPQTIIGDDDVLHRPSNCLASSSSKPAPALAGKKYRALLHRIVQGGFQRLVKLGSSHRFVKEAVTGVFGFAQALSGGIAREYESRDFALIPVLNALDRMLACHPVPQTIIGDDDRRASPTK